MITYLMWYLLDSSIVTLYFFFLKKSNLYLWGDNLILFISWYSSNSNSVVLAFQWFMMESINILMVAYWLLSNSIILSLVYILIQKIKRALSNCSHLFIYSLTSVCALVYLFYSIDYNIRFRMLKLSWIWLVGVSSIWLLFLLDMSS